MVKVKCPKDSEIFDWDESKDVTEDCNLTDQPSETAKKISVSCPKCETDIILYVECPLPESDSLSEIGRLLREYRGIKPRNRITTEDDPFDMF